MSGTMTVIVYMLIFVVAGIVISLLALLMPARWLAQRSPVARKVAILAVGLASFVITLGLYNGDRARISYSVSCFGMDPRGNELCQEARSDVALTVSEIWIRHVVPPPLRQHCYTGYSSACRLADHIFTRYGYSSWGTEYLLEIVLSLVSPLVTGTVVWHLTREKGRPGASLVAA